MRIYLADTYHGNIKSAVEGNRDMRIYMSSAGNDVAGQLAVEGNVRRLSFLTSFYYYKDADMETIFGQPIPSLMADSGAFSAQTMGTAIELTEYADWVKRWEPLFDHYANLDVIGDPEATLANQRRLEDMGLHPMPVFHVGSPWEYLERYLEEYDHIALGGMVPHVRRYRQLIPWIVKAFRMLTPGKGYHGFGTTGWKIMSSFPWNSVDSSSWGAGYQYGQGVMFSNVKGGFVKFLVKDAKSCYALRHDFARYGHDWREFAEPTDDPLFGVKSEFRRKICVMSARAYLEAEDWMSRRHGKARIYLATPMIYSALGTATNTHGVERGIMSALDREREGNIV